MYKKFIFVLLLAVGLFTTAFAQTADNFSKIRSNLQFSQTSPGDIERIVDILKSPFVLVKTDGNVYGYDTYAEAVADLVDADDVILHDGVAVIDTGFVTYWAQGGAVVSATTGTDVACSDGDRYWVAVTVTNPTLLQGICYLVGSVGGTDSVIVELYNSAGTVVATSDTTTVGQNADIVGTAANFQSVAFDIPYFAVPGIYYASVQFDGTTAKFRAYPIAGSPFVAGTDTGTFGTEAAIDPGTTFTADKGPILLLY